ncbi:hypothetical protein GGR50DRAFT_637513 [Xylaria sp. CBS 124048]|nr:hypothetical protein GGR50DRAFT_637513 [Xylaria sp. CBS 124048]
MPYAQLLLPAETRTGPGVIGPLSDLLGAGWNTTSRLFARARSAIRLGGPDDMPKPANLGATAPMNTLYNNRASRTPVVLASSSWAASMSPSPSPIRHREPETDLETPPPKRLKLSQNESSPVHFPNAHTTVITSTSRKRSAGGSPVTDSRSSPPISKGIPEFRALDRWTNPGQTHTRRAQTKLPRLSKDIEGGRESHPAPLKIKKDAKDDISDDDDDVDLIGSRETLSSSRAPEKEQPIARPISDIARNFRGGKTSARLGVSQFFSAVVNSVDRRNKTQFQELDWSPDELAPSWEDFEVARPPKKRRQLAPSLSKRGDILPTTFSSTSADGSSTATGTEYQRVDRLRSEIDSIIGRGLRVLQGVCGRCLYQTGNKDDPDYCLLSACEPGHILLPVDKDRNPLKLYEYLIIDIRKVKHILHAGGDHESTCIISVGFDSANIATGAGPKLMVEFAPDDFSRFMQWVGMCKNDNPTIVVKVSKRDKLEKDFYEMIQRTTSHTAITEASIPVGDDIKVIHYNRNNCAPGTRTDPFLATRSSSRPIMRNAMKRPFISAPSDDGIAASQAWDGKRPATQGESRTTRSRSASIGSPKSQFSEPEGWTMLNPNWEKQWRNSLVYPATGRNRAIVDKDDIQRLDEGQFLNDNIIIFYLRYLQQKLEDDEPDLARRVYFHNTFFYDKLKPTKTGRGINYDSVKAWTSKVDLFSKDYIIVPINEYTHWYVAIIYNAPKLVLCPEGDKQVDGIENDVIAILDDIDVSREHLRAPKDDTSRAHINDENIDTRAQENVIQGLRRMSIDSTDQPHSETKQEMDNGASEGVESTVAGAENDHRVDPMNDSNGLQVEIEDIVTAASPQHRKNLRKGQNAGPRKYDPDQPRIITLDSLGATHSPTCSYLRQYLAAELLHKKGMETTAANAKGITAREVPEQTNHCDCGLFLLGYIQQFLVDPDTFIKSLLQRDRKISWNLDPSKLRNDIRNLIFDLQKKQQETEDAAHARKARARMKARAKLDVSSPATAPTPDSSHTPPKMVPNTWDIRESTLGEDKSLPASSPISQSSSSKCPDAISGGAMYSENWLDPKMRLHSSAPIILNDGSRNMPQLKECGHSNEDGVRIMSMTGTSVTASHRKTGQSDNETNHQTTSAIPTLPTLPTLPVRGQTVQDSPRSSDAGSSIDIPTTFLPPLVSETPSAKSSRGGTPLDPVVLDEPDNTGQDKTHQSDLKNTGFRRGYQFVVAIPSRGSHSGSQGRSNEVHSRKQTGEQSSYFAHRQDGERVTAAKLRENTHKDVIDLSKD